jgi:hypothetical protein
MNILFCREIFVVYAELIVFNIYEQLNVVLFMCKALVAAKKYLLILKFLSETHLLISVII